ncbi:hypothetical protein [Sphingobacterium sp.]|uniref:type II toxin-antitoxin system RelE/ParE family toxin n=1 Tax=Sphingobacterium sp. TaxID=341027 RepID=UPI0031DA9B2E
MHCCGIERYHNDIKKLKKSYPNIEKDVRDEFKGMTFDHIFELKQKLSDSGISRVLKVRIANSHNQSGKSGGFRLYLLANVKEQHVTFLTIYPKTNKGGRSNLDKNEVKELIAEYNKEKKDASLKVFSLIENKEAT